MKKNYLILFNVVLLFLTLTPSFSKTHITSIDIPDGTYLGKAIRTGKAKKQEEQELAVVVANGYISILVDKSTEDSELFFFPIIANYKQLKKKQRNIRISFDGTNLKLFIREKRFTIKGSAKFISLSEGMENPYKIFSNHEKLENDERCNDFVNIGRDGYAIITLIVEHNDMTEIAEFFFGKVNPGGTFTTTYSTNVQGTMSLISNVSITEDKILITGSGSTGPFTSTFLRELCPL